ncbi:MAG: Prephenate/arogenate dehydrogenase protein [Dehalococcoidales bacterium]|nr:Prephenate/arogenate dehydrogenase protein [Dehalococcoidales bacterium]
MGRWFANFLLKDGKEVVITGRDEKKLAEAGQQLGVEVATNREAVRNADVILLSVPIDSFESVVKEIAPWLTPNQIIMDITSVKGSTVDIMHQYIKTGLVLGVHPMFGPGARDITNQNFVLTPTDEKELALANKVKQYLVAHGTRVTLMTPREHDEMMAVILGLAHFIAIVSADTLLSLNRLPEMEAIGGSTYKLLLTLAKGVMTEDAEFYASLQMNLPGVTEIQEQFQRSSATWANIVKNKNRPEFVRSMNALRDKMAKADPDFRKAYENMYRLIGE